MAKKFNFIDLNNVRTEEEFYNNLATTVLRASSTKIQVIGENARKFIGRFIPNLTFRIGQQFIYPIKARARLEGGEEGPGRYNRPA